MKDRQRLDKILANMGLGSRSEIRKRVKQGEVQVNGSIVKDSGAIVHPYQDTITLAGEVIHYRKYIYLMLHKPPGVLSATEDRVDRTVIDLLAETYKHFQPFPVGRLDKDTEGLLLITNDGQLAHDLLSPRKQVDKTYYARVKGLVDDSAVRAFQQHLNY